MGVLGQCCRTPEQSWRRFWVPKDHGQGSTEMGQARLLVRSLALGGREGILVEEKHMQPGGGSGGGVGMQHAGSNSGRPPQGRGGGTWESLGGVLHKVTAP